jgi:hypothetical protein
VRARALTLVHSEPRRPSAIRLLGWAKSLVVSAAIFAVAVSVCYVAIHLANHIVSPATADEGCCGNKGP